MGREAEIRALDEQISLTQQQLIKIHQLKKSISERTWSAAKPVEDINGVLINKERIEFRVAEIAAELVSKFPDCNPILVGVMDGGLPFLELLRNALSTLKYPFRYTAMSASSYGTEITSGSLSIHYLGKYLPGGETMILVDDVLDTGQTFLRIKQEYLSQGAKQVELVTLVEKRKQRTEKVDAIAAFQVSDHFLIGKGLDYLLELRNEDELRQVVDLTTLESPEEKAEMANEGRLNDSLKLLISTRDRLIQGTKHVRNQSEISAGNMLLADIEDFMPRSPGSTSVAASIGQFLSDVTRRSAASPRQLSTPETLSAQHSDHASADTASLSESDEDFLVRQPSQPDDGSSSAMASSLRM